MSFEDMPINESTPIIPWTRIEERLDTLTPAEGGNSDAERGIITLPNETKVFVKRGVNEHTKGWAAKEVKAYSFLEEQGYQYIPKLLSANEDQTAFAIEALPPEDGWDWSETWTKERVDATLVALDALANIKPEAKYAELLKPVLTDADNGWEKLITSQEKQTALLAKLQAIEVENMDLDFSQHAEKAKDYQVQHDTLVHDDVRADNCPWNEERKEVKLVDWNWLELGDRRLDLAATLVHIHNSGFNVLEDYSERLDVDALHWMAGFWLEAASKPIWPGGP